jgi:AraC-like DNA-binding protein
VAGTATVQQHRARPAVRAVSVELLPHLRRARDHIDRYYQQPLDLAGLAAVAGVSKFHFARCFEATYGETPIRYLSRRRIERAQDLLRAANLTVTEICMVVGFASLGSFSSRFAQLVGESPAAYRDRWAAQGGPHIPGCYLFVRGVRDPRGTAGQPPGRDGAIWEKRQPGRPA